MNALKSWYENHFQKTLATVIGMLALVDLSGIADPLKTVIGNKAFAVVQLACAAAVVYRALQAKTATPA